MVCLRIHSWLLLLACVAWSSTAVAAAPCPSSDETDEIHCQHPDIVAKAGELATPLRIYQFVRNEIEYDVYFGSKKGALGTLWSGRGNDFDQASLLIALLRAIGVEARYAIGMVNIDVKQFGEWARTASASAALDVFQTQYCRGLEGEATQGPCGVTPPRFIRNEDLGAVTEHAWAEARLPAPYRGVDVGETGLRWIPLDPSWKQKPYPSAWLALPIGAEATCAPPQICFNYTSYYSKFDPRLASEIWERQVRSAFAGDVFLEGKNVEDYIYDGPIIPDEGEVLPTSLPFIPERTPPTVNTLDLGLLSDPLERRFKFALHIKDEQWGTVHTFGGSLPSAGEIPFASLVGKRLTVVWEPLADDRALVLQWGGYEGGSPDPEFETLLERCITWYCSVRVIPVLKIDDVRYPLPVQYPQPLGGTTQSVLQIDRDLLPGYRPPAVEHTLTNGVHFSVVLDTDQVGPAQIQERIDALLSIEDDFPLLDEGEIDLNGNQVPGEVLVDQGVGGPDGVISPCADFTVEAAMDTCDIALAARFRYDPEDPIDAEIDEVLGELLHLAALRYTQRLRQEAERVFALHGFVGIFSPTVGIVRSGAHFTYLFEQPIGVEPSAPVIDIPGVEISAVPADGVFDAMKFRLQARLVNHIGSALEHQVWEELTGLEFLSTVKGIQLVRERFPEQPVQILRYPNPLTPPPAWNPQATSCASWDFLHFRFDSMGCGTRVAIQQIAADTDYTARRIVVPVAAVVPETAGSPGIDVYYAEKTDAEGIVGVMAITLNGQTLGGGVYSPYYDYLLNSIFGTATRYSSESILLSHNFGWGDLLDPLRLWNDPSVSSHFDPALFSAQVGDPVSMISGNLQHTETDVSIASDGPAFEFTRTYNSRVEEAGALGFGWTHSYDLRVQAVRDVQEFVYLPSSLSGFKEPWMEAVRSDTLVTSNEPTWADEFVTWAPLSEAFLEGVEAIEAVTLELAFRPRNSFTVNPRMTPQGESVPVDLDPVVLQSHTGTDYETFELVTADGKPPDIGQAISIKLTGFEDAQGAEPDALYYARLRIRYRGAGVERVELEAQSRPDWQDDSKLADADPSTCTQPSVQAGPGSILFAPQSPAGSFGTEILVSVVREGAGPYEVPHGRLWLGPVSSGVPISVGPGGEWLGYPWGNYYKFGAQMRFMTPGAPTDFTVHFESDFAEPGGTWDVELCDLHYRILVMPRQRDVVLENGSRARFTDRGTPGAPEWEAAPGIREQLREDANGFELIRPDGRILRFDHAAADVAYLLTRSSDPQGRSLVMDYDPGSHKLLSVSDDSTIQFPTGPTTTVTITPALTFTYDANGYLKTLQDWSIPSGSPRVWDFEVVADNLVQARNPDQVDRDAPGTHYAYDLSSQTENPDLVHNLTQVTYPKNGGQHDVTFSYYLSDRVASHTDSLNNRQTYLFNIPRLESQATDPRGHTTIYRHDRNSDLVERVDPDRATWNWEYDDDRNVTKEIDPFGRERQYLDYDPTCARPRRIIDRDGKETLVTYDVTEDPPGPEGPARISCAELTLTDKRGHVRTFARTHGLVTSVSSTLGSEAPPGTVLLTNVYDDPVNPRRLDRVVRAIAVGEARRHVQALVYRTGNDRDVERIEDWEDANGNGILGEPGDALLAATDLEYDVRGRVRAQHVVRIDDPEGASTVVLTTGYEYDLLGRPERVTRPDGTVLVSLYDDNGNLEFQFLEETRPNGTPPIEHARQDFQYDAVDRLQSVMEPLGVMTVFQYDTSGNRTATIDPEGNATRVEYDALNRPMRTIDATGAVSAVEYDLLGRVVAEIDPTGVRTTRGYDGNLQIGQVTPPTPQIGKLSSVRLGNLGPAVRAVIYGGPNPRDYREELGDPNIWVHGQITTFYFDALGRVERIVDAEAGETEMVYDLLGNLTQLTDPSGAVSTFGYDALSRLVSEEYPYTTAGRSTQYDETGNPVRITKADDCQIDLSYDRMGRRTRQRSTGACTGVAPLDDRFGYDARGNLVAAKNGDIGLIREYDALGRLEREIDTRFGTAVAYRYDAASRLLAKVYPDGSVLTVSHDPAGRPIGITDPFGDTTRYVYDAAGRRIETQSAGSALSTLLAYETITGRLSGVTSLRSTDGSPAVARAYPLYDHAGNRLQVTDASGATDYSYDVLHRLKSADPPNAEVTHYDYDATGNRRQSGGKLGGGFVPPYETYEYEDLPNPTHKLLAVRDHNEDPVHQFGAYDPNGNPGTWFRAGEGTRTLTWDALDRLVAISDSYEASYVYDPLGRRIEKTEAGTTTLYQYDGLDVVAEYSAAHALQATYVFGPGIDEPIKVRRDTTVSSYHADGLGSILAVAQTTASGTDFATYTYGPFGEDEATTLEPGFANAYTYTGRERDGSGLYYYRARYYLAEVGRFLTPDPIGLRGGINPYAYVGSNPINFTDPFGLLPKNSYSNLASPLSGTVSQGAQLAYAGAGLTAGGVVGAGFGYGAAALATAAAGTAFAPALAGAAVFAAGYGVYELTVGGGWESVAGSAQALWNGTATAQQAFGLGLGVGSFAGGFAGGAYYASAAARAGPLSTAYRYVGAGEASIIEKTGLVPNVTRIGQPKNVSLTPLEFRSASQAEQALGIGRFDPRGPAITPTHGVEVNLRGVPLSYGGTGATGVGGIEVQTPATVRALRIFELEP